MENSILHTENDLLKRVAAGDEAAFTQLFDSYWDNIYGVAYVITKSRETARDIVQEVFVKIWLLREELVNKDNFRNFLFIVARNHIFSELRKKKKRPGLYQSINRLFSRTGR